ncbi:MAG: hypothetical protein LUF92_02195 [Clostridiales bacterium]|nr:hypothetical protein [Clostridiales bacterium]
MVGKWFDERRVKGLDRISRAQIPKITEQVKRLIPKGKDIVLEGDKVVSGKIFDELLDMGAECQLYWIRCSEKMTLKRNRKNGSTQKESSIKAVATKAKNMFWQYAPMMNGMIIDTEEITDWESFSLKSAKLIKPYKKKRKAREDFAVFILTHGRADNVVTLHFLQRAGYTGRWYMIIDDEDDQRGLYEKNFGAEHVIVFDKQAAYDRADTMDNFNNHSAIIYARNESWRIAKELGLNYFLMLDDDYTRIDYRWEENGMLRTRMLPDMDRVFEDMLVFLDATGATSVAFCQNGDFVGGLQGGTFKKGLLRKAMNSFFCRTDTPIEFKGTMNEDVVTYTTLSSRGILFLSVTACSVRQIPTQSLEGGMTDFYKESGTYMKSFYAVMSMPSAVKVDLMYTKHKRIHHRVNWECCAPKILNQKWQKEG